MLGSQTETSQQPENPRPNPTRPEPGDTAAVDMIASIFPPLYSCTKHESTRSAIIRKYLHLDVSWQQQTLQKQLEELLGPMWSYWWNTYGTIV